MSRNYLLDYYEILELPNDASWSEVRRSYLNLKELYSKPSIVTQSLNEDSLEGLNEEIIEKVDKAYKELETYYTDIRIENEKKIECIVAKIDFFCGSSLKKIREELNIDLLDIAISSNIQINHLKNIENEAWDSLPSGVYLKGYLKSYAKYISLDAARVVEDYMQGYLKWKEQSLNVNEADR